MDVDNSLEACARPSFLLVSMNLQRVALGELVEVTARKVIRLIQREKEAKSSLGRMVDRSLISTNANALTKSAAINAADK